MKPIFVAFCLGLVLTGECNGKTERKCKDGDQSCVEYDDHYEEAAKEVILEKPNHISFAFLNKHMPKEKRNLTDVSENGNLTDWWIQWYQITRDLPQINPKGDVKRLCKPVRAEDKFIDCAETSFNTLACIGTKNETIDQCLEIERPQFLLPICKEVSSNRVVTCGLQSTFLCYPLEENKPPIKPCQNPFRQICLSRNGSLVKCIQTNFFTNLDVLSILKNTPKGKLKNTSTLWWKKWKRPTPEQKVKDSENKSAPLCLMKETNGKLRYCDEKETIAKACMGVENGKIAECKSFTNEEMAVPLCSEVSSNRVLACDKAKKTFLCFHSAYGKKHVQPCDIADRQICLNDDGLLQKCSKSPTSSNSNHISEEMASGSNDYRPWDEWWLEWVTDLPVTVEVKDVPLCKPDEHSENITTCGELSSDAKACVSAKRGEIDLCKKLNDSDLPVPLCKESTNKVISCNDYGSAFLCMDVNVTTKSIRPCRSENRHLCLTDGGLLKRCSDIRWSDDSKVRGDTSLEKDDFLYWNRWWEEWFSIRYGLQNNLSERVSVRLCMTKSERLFGCLDDFSNNMACVGAKEGKIGVCEEMQSTDFPIPICREGLTNNVITCGRHANALLCFPRSKKSSFIKPCLSIEREACLGLDGKLEFCIKSATYYTYYRNKESGGKITQNPMTAWDDWWNEWNTNSLNDESTEVNGTSLCLKDSNKNMVTNCKGDEPTKKLCVSARYWKISDCKGLKDSDLPLSICSDSSSKRIMTCSNGTSAFICVHGRGKSALIFPCRSPSLQLCLTVKGLLQTCSDESSKSLKVVEMGSTTIPAEYIYAKYRQRVKSTELRFLCKPENSSRILPCSAQFSHSPACLNTKKGKIESCEKIERHHAIGLPVCIDVNTSKLLTCGKFSEANLCLPRSRKTHPIKPCKTKSKYVCITAEGKLAKCSKSLKNTTSYYVEDNESNVLIRMEYKYFEYEQKNVTSLCMQDKKMLKECTSDPTVTFACLSSKKGIIHSCESGEPSNLSIPLCIQGQKKAVVTCGKFNNVNLCSFSNDKSSTYRPCNTDEHFICFRDGLIHRCQENKFIYRKNDSYLKGNKDNNYKVSGYQNSKKVYEFESESIQAMLNNCSRLCELDVRKNEIGSCEEDPFINFACFGVSEGTVRSCESFSSTDLIMPVCVETTKKVVTHGKFFKAYLCFQESSDDVKIQICNTQNQHICLTKKGSLEKCKHNEHGINMESLEGNKKRVTISTEQSTIKSHFNSNINENGTSKENKTLEDNIEEITDEDYSEKLTELTPIKWNKKTFKLLKGKHKYNKESAKKTKGTMKVLEKSIKKEKDQNENHGSQKRKHLKKDYNNDKKSDGSKKSSKVKSKSRAGKSIKNFINAVTSKLSTDEAINTNEYEYDIFNDELSIGDKSYTADYSEIMDELMKSDYSYDQEGQKVYKAMHREAIKEKELILIADIHTISRHLCKMSTDNKKLINCDEDSQLNFACVGANEGNIRMCHEFAETYIPFPICFQANSRNLFTCDIFSNVQLCLAEKGDSTVLTPCGNTNRHACLGEDSVPVECSKHVMRRDGSMLQFKNPDPNDEKFYRLICNNCSIENKFILNGEPDDVLPTLEVFTYPPK